MTHCAHFNCIETIVNYLKQSLVIVPQLRHDDRSIRHRAYDPYYFEHKFRIVTLGERLIE